MVEQIIREGEGMRMPHYICQRCGYDWIPRTEVQPRTCPKCKSPYWDRPRRTPKTELKAQVA